MKTRFIISMVITSILFFTSCEKDKYMPYQGSEYLQFSRDAINRNDTISHYTFFYDADSIIETEVLFPVIAMGGPKSYDRPFYLEQLTDIDTLYKLPEAGVDFEPFDSEKSKKLFVIKAGEVQYNVPITIYRKKLNTDQYFLKFRIVPNEHFKKGESSYALGYLQFSSGVSRPSSWSGPSEKWFLGKYSLTKHAWMIEQTRKYKFRWDDDCILKVNTEGTMDYWYTKFQEEINRINEERKIANGGIADPWLDENGYEINMGLLYI